MLATLILALASPPSMPKPPHPPIVHLADTEYGIPREERVPETIFVGKSAQQSPWSHERLNVKELWRRAPSRGKGIVVAVLDTGIDEGHYDLAGKVVKSIAFAGSNPRDAQGHGTHCAGIIAASDNENGVVGIAPEAKLLNVKVLGDNGSGSSVGIAKGIRWAVDNGAHVISMSLGGPTPDADTRAACQYAKSKGVIVVCAAGNEGPGDNTVGYPGGYEEVICVASSNESGRISTYSSRGRQVDIAAPGEKILSTYPGDRLATLSGTSMATPYVAGLVAVILSHAESTGQPKPDQDKVMDLLQASAVDLAPPGKDEASGAGIVDPPKTIVAGPAPPVAPGTGDVVIGLDDFTDAARTRILAADPNFTGIIVKRKPGDTMTGNIEEVSFPTGVTYWRLRINGTWYEIPNEVAEYRFEWIGQRVSVILEIKGGKVIRASFTPER